MIRAWSCGRGRVQGGVRLGRLKRPGGDRGGEEGKGEREPLTGGPGGAARERAAARAG